MDTALHSMPYLVAVALTDGEVGPRQFTQARLNAPDLRRLVDRTRVVEDPSLTAAYPRTVASRIEVSLAGGRRLKAECKQPLGHTANPLTDAQIERKLRAAAGPAMSDAQASKLVAACWDLESLDNISQLLRPA